MSFHHDQLTPIGELIDRLGERPPVVLAVWAHPDDESFLAGGLLAEIARRGGRVINVCATSGELGTDDPEANPPALLGARRRGELAAALAELGAAESIQLEYLDGSCGLIADRLGAAAVGRIIDRVEADVVVTFGPDGVTGHPDHQAVARWTRRAVADRGDRTPLITTVAASAWPRWCIERLHRIGAFWPGYPERRAGYPERSDAAGFRAVGLPSDVVARKLAALDRHESQMAPVRAALGTDGLAALAAAEAYQAANLAAFRRLAVTTRLVAA